MSAYVSHSVGLYKSAIIGGTELTFNALSADDDDFEIVSLQKQRLDWAILETVIGYRTIYHIRIQQITTSQRNFLYSFIQNEDQRVRINGVLHSVYLRDSELMLDLLDGYVGNVVLTMEFEDKLITTPSTLISSTTHIYKDGSIGYRGVTTGVGTIVSLTYNYGSAEIRRTFQVNSVHSYKAEILDKRWEYIDKNRGVKRLGYRLLFDIDFGSFGLGQTEASLQDDRDWLKEFVLAPYKYVDVFGQYIGEVVNNFDSVNYDLLGGSIYNKTTKLSFKQKELQTNLPTLSSSAFILDSPTFGTLDNNVLG